MKRFAYLSVSVLCLAAAYQIGAERAGASWSWSDRGIAVGGVDGGSEGFLVWSRTGQAWRLGEDGWHEAPSALELPVSPSEVKLVESDGAGHLLLITLSDEAHYFAGEWTEVGPFPVPRVTLDPDSWGDLKVHNRE